MKKNRDADIEDSRWDVKWGPGHGDRAPPATKQETIHDTNNKPHTGRKGIAFKNEENVWVFRWSKLSTDKKKRSIDHEKRRGEQTRWEDMIYE